MVGTRPGSLSSISAAATGRSQPGKTPSLRTFLIRNSNVLLLGLAVCALLSLGAWPLHGTSPPSSGGSLGRRGQGDGALSTDAVAATVTAGAGVHGYVRKEGMADLRNWHPDYKTFRQQRLQDWLAERDASLAEGRLPPPLPVYTGCQVYVNHLYRIVYLRHAKTASSSLFCHFGGCRSNSSDPAEQALRFELLQGKDAAELAALWRDYFVVTFVRSPYQRAVSSYRMMARQLAPGGPAAGGYTWDRFCADPTSFADECMRDDLCQKKGRNFVYIHIQPQHDCIITEGGGWAVDFVGRVESIDADLQAVLDELERRRPAEAPPVKPLQGSLANVNGRGCNESATDGHNVAPEQYCDPAQYFEGRHAACLGQVRHHYYSDAHSLRFGPGELADE